MKLQTLLGLIHLQFKSRNIEEICDRDAFYLYKKIDEVLSQQNDSKEDDEIKNEQIENKLIEEISIHNEKQTKKRGRKPGRKPGRPRSKK